MNWDKSAVAAMSFVPVVLCLDFDLLCAGAFRRFRVDGGRLGD